MKSFFVFGLFSSVIILSAASQLRAQDDFGGLIIGYNGGGFTTSQRNFEINMWESNNETGEKNNLGNYLGGFHLGYGAGSENFQVDLLWSHKRQMTEEIKFVAENAPAPDTIGIQQFKIRLNSINVGFAGGVEAIKLGVSVDFGLFKIFNKSGSESDNTLESFKDAEWEKYYDSKSQIFLGTSLYMILRYKLFYVKPYYQFGHWQDAFFYQKSTLQSMHTTNNWGVCVGFMFILPS